MHPRRSFTPPNYSVSAVGGSGWKIGEDQRLGVLASFNYGRSYKLRKSEVQVFVPDIDRGPGGEEISTARADKQLEIEQGEDRRIRADAKRK